MLLCTSCITATKGIWLLLGLNVYRFPPPDTILIQIHGYFCSIWLIFASHSVVLPTSEKRFNLDGFHVSMESRLRAFVIYAWKHFSPCRLCEFSTQNISFHNIYNSQLSSILRRVEKLLPSWWSNFHPVRWHSNNCIWHFAYFYFEALSIAFNYVAFDDTVRIVVDSL